MSLLAQLSAPGFNRAIGSGDVVPYMGQSGQTGGAVGGATTATPGASFDPTAGQATSPAGGGSFLNNLSALTPLLNEIFQQQQAAAIPSGQGNAQANPLQGAAAGPGSQDIAQQIAASAGGVPIAGGGGVAGIGAPPASSASPAGGGGPVVAPLAQGGEGAVGDASGPGPGAAPGDSGPGPGPGDASGPSGDGGGGAGGGGGATVICTELRRQGYLDENVWIADAAFGRSQSQATRDGYRLWAAPLARGMALSRVLTVAVAALAIPWAVEMAYQMGVRKHGSLVGRAVMAIGLPLCTYLGENFRKESRA